MDFGGEPAGNTSRGDLQGARAAGGRIPPGSDHPTHCTPSGRGKTACVDPCRRSCSRGGWASKSLSFLSRRCVEKNTVCHRRQEDVGDVVTERIFPPGTKSHLVVAVAVRVDQAPACFLPPGLRREAGSCFVGRRGACLTPYRVSCNAGKYSVLCVYLASVSALLWRRRTTDNETLHFGVYTPAAWIQ